MKFTVRMRLLFAFGFVVLAFVALGIYAIFSLKTVNNQTTIINTKWLPGVSYSQKLEKSVSEYRLREYRHILAADSAEMNDMEQQAAEVTRNAETYIAEYQKIDNGTADDEAFSEFQTNWRQYLSLSKKVLELSRQDRDAEAMAIMRGEAKQSYDGAVGAAQELVAFNAQQSDSATQNGIRVFSSTSKIMIITIVVVALIVVAVSLVITNGIIQPIKKLGASADKIAQGNLDVEIDISSKDEIGALSKSFETMTSNVNEILSNIRFAAEQVASGSSQVSDSSVALSQGATEQASSIEQLTASLEEISVQTKQNADDANRANDMSDSVKTNAAQGNMQMNEMLTAMDEINVSSSNISKIIKVIDEIAFQTNILALNAAVEAARAGKHGKGFAVVAEEVRNLAARSAKAAKETTDLIEGSIKKVEAGTEIAHHTAEALNMIVEGVTQVSNLVGNIAIASNEQSSGIAQINQGILQVSEVVQTNSATAEESAAASEELSSQALLLKEQVARFVLRTSYQTARLHQGAEEVSPEVLKMLEQMNKDKKATRTEAHAGAGTGSAKKIILSDLEFGKY